MEGGHLIKYVPALRCPVQDSSPSLPVDVEEAADLRVSPVRTAPPPPPPPPPPPALLLPSCSFGSCDVKRCSMKKLNWDTIPSQNVLGKLNVWTSQRPQRDLVLDIRSMEELFSHQDKRALLRSSGAVGLNKCESVDLVSHEPQVTILHSKRSMNIGIFLRHFKRPLAEIVQDIHQGNWLTFGTGKLQELCKLLPEQSEVRQLLSFNGNVSGLPEADQFMVQLVKVPYYEERVKMMVLREEFFPLMEEVKHSVAIMTKAANELLDCDDLHSVIRLVLKAGNYMNAGGFSANAIGFRMTSLLKLADTKANRPGMNLMHYVAKQAEGIDPELLTFLTQLDHIGMASRICKQEVITDFETEVLKIKEVKLYSAQQLGLFQQMGTFLTRAEATLEEMESSLQELKDLSNEVAGYFCEDPATFKLEECCSIFHSFCKRFETAVQENQEREAVEQKRKRKENSRTKRRSTVSGPRPESKGDSASLESALHSFLSIAPEGMARCRKNAVPPVRGSSPVHGSSPGLIKKKMEAKLPENEERKLSQKNEQIQNQEIKQEAEISRKVLSYRKSTSNLDEDKVSDSSRRVERERAKFAIPTTPVPRTRDFCFANNGAIGSPWTILSPFTCSQINNPYKNRENPQHRLTSAFGEVDLDDGVWVSDGSSTLSNSSEHSQSSSSASLCESIKRKPSSQSPVRSLSVDETRRSSSSGFRLGDLLQRSMLQRSYSSGSRTENRRDEGTGVCFTLGRKNKNCEERRMNAFGFMSFLKRFGGRIKPGNLEEQNFKESST